MSVALTSPDDKGVAPETRIKSYKDATAIYDTLRKADATNARNRDLVHRLIRGDPPRDQDLMEEAGMGDFSNFNCLKAAADTDQAITTFVGLADSTPTLISVKTKFGDPNQRGDWEQAIAEEYTWLMRERWESYYDRQQTKAVGLVSDGLALNYWPHAKDWRSEVGRPGQFLFPSDASTDVAKWDLVLQVEYVQATRLYELLKKDDEVKKAGDVSTINRDAIIAAIKAACTSDQRTIGDDILERFRDNDLYASYASSQEIKLVHYYVKEYTGKISHYVGRADGGGDDFLEVHKEAFDSMARCFVPYADGVGTGKIASLQGIIWRAYPSYYADNELRNQAHDAVKLACIMMMKTGMGAQSAEKMAQMVFNPVTMLPPGVEPVQNNFNPTALTSLFPLLSENKELIANNTGGYASHDFSPEGGSRTAREVGLQAANAAQIGGAKIINYYRSEAAFHRETTRRLFAQDYDQHCPGAEERREFFARLHDRGVPPQAVFGVFEVKTVRAIGLGSPAAMAAAFQVLGDKRQFMDPQGQRTFDRMQCASVGTDYSTLDQVLPALPAVRPTIGDRFAVFENDTFRNGALIMPFEDDDPYIHIPVHLPLGDETLQKLQQGLIDAKQAVRQMGPLLQHLQAHFKVANDPQRKDQVKVWQKAFDGFEKQFNQLTAQVQQQAQATQPAPVDPKLALDGLTALGGLLKDGAPITHEQLDVGLQKAGFPPFPDGLGVVQTAQGPVSTPINPAPGVSLADQAAAAKAQAEIVRNNAVAQAEIVRKNALAQQDLAHADLTKANDILDTAQPQVPTAPVVPQPV